MDPLGLLQALVALAVYPGGVYLAIAALALRLSTGLRNGDGLTAAGVAAIAAATVAASMATLPASPAASLPPQGGTAPNLAIAAVVLGAGIAVGTPGPWSRRRLLAAAAALVPLAALAAGSATLSLPGLTTQQGAAFLAARAGAAAAVLGTAPLLCGLFGPGPVAVRATLTAAAAILAAGLVAPAHVSGWAAAATAAGVVAGVFAYGYLTRLIVRRGPLRHRLLLALGTAGSAAAVAAIAVTAR